MHSKRSRTNVSDYNIDLFLVYVLLVKSYGAWSTLHSFEISKEASTGRFAPDFVQS